MAADDWPAIRPGVGDRRTLEGYIAPGWLPGGHLQTIWAARVARPSGRSAPTWRRERWATPDGDFVDVDFADGPPGSRWLVLLHGLEGSSRGHYSLAFAEVAKEQSLTFVVPHFRGCSGELNLAPRAYHSGDFEEVGWILGRLRQASAAPLSVVGISLGGNALLRWVQEVGEAAASVVRGVAAVCSPLDLAAAGRSIDSGLNRLIYARMFLATMKPKALAKLAQYPGLFDEQRLRRAGTLWEFDDVFTAPLHGFGGADEYWALASAKPHLKSIRVPTLVVNSLNDPFIPRRSLPVPAESGLNVTLWQPTQGGHVGFPAGSPPCHLKPMPQAVVDWLSSV